MKALPILYLCPGLLFYTGCIKISNPYTAIPPGIWRATLELSADSADIAEERTKGILPFNFEVEYLTVDSFHVIIRNREERIRCTDIDFGWNRQIGKDTMRIEVPAFGTYFTGKYEEDAIEGYWWDPSRGSQYRIPFRAYHGRDYRFHLKADASYQDFAGHWRAMFSVEKETPYPAILVVEQKANMAMGTILTETGDYRYLEGSAEEDRLFLSTFDGSHAYLFEAKLLEDGMISGIFRSGNHYKTYWSAERDAAFQLRHPDSLTTIQDTGTPFALSFPNTEGRIISLTDPRYAGKPKLVNIFGTWCPNCLDEMTFLLDYLQDHPGLDIEIISIAYERHQDTEKALNAIRNYQQQLQIPWEILYGGSFNKKHVAESLPQLSEFVSFPTMIFLDRSNRVVKIHTGFFGPATEKYAGFVEDFEISIQALTSSQAIQ